jgi:putative ABC transport system permease protein
MRRLGLLADLQGDASYALRLLARSPGFTAVALATLALGIGANLTVFTLANAFLFKNLPFDDSDRILYLSSAQPGRPDRAQRVSYPDFLDFGRQTATFDGLAAFMSRTVDVSDRNGFPERYRATVMTANSFALIGQSPVRGRDFLPEDCRPGAQPVAILGYGLWQNRYGLDTGIIGRSIRINDVSTQIIGVMPSGLNFPGTTDLWQPLIPAGSLERRDSRTLTLFGRLARGVTLPAARAESNAIAARLAAEYSNTNKGVGSLVENFNDRFNGRQTRLLFVSLLGSVGFVLLIACANVANLLLARAVERTREVSIRAALGASRWRTVRQLLVESLLLSIAGGGLGWLAAGWGVRLFDAALLPAVKPPYIDFSMDLRAFVYLGAVTLGTGVLFGLAPALQASRVDVNSALKEGGSATGQGGRARLLSSLLVVTEVCLAVVLLTGAGLMIRSLLNTSKAHIGLDPKNVLCLSVDLRSAKYPRAEHKVLFYDRLKARLDSLPGADVCAIASDLPAESPDSFAYEVESPWPAARERLPKANGLVVGIDYFRAMQVRLQSGRVFAAADTSGTMPVVIVNRSFAREAWPRESAVGKRLRLVETERGAGRATPPTAGAWLTVIGVAPDILQDDESFEVGPVIYFPFYQRPQGGMEIVVRTSVPPGTLGDAIRREVQVLDEDLAVRGLRSLEAALWLRNWRYRVFGTVFAILAAIALLLASVGLYAVVAHSVSQRTREIGVRVALGASSASILGLVFRQGMLQVALGLAAGLAVSFGTTRVLEALLVGVTPADPMTFAGVVLVLIAAGVLGCAFPAQGAMRVDPVVALRNQ